jgi:hypothetical protein
VTPTQTIKKKKKTINQVKNERREAQFEKKK